LSDFRAFSIPRIDLEIRHIHPDAITPTKARPTDAGYDIYAVEDIELPPATSTYVKTGVQISAPPGYYFTIDGRSSMWSKGVVPDRGIIDSTYTGELLVALYNRNITAYHVKKGDRIAQILLHRQLDANFNVVEQFSSLYNSRGTDGFGSTGR
jgi:dUTP pyrophosphatase